jgi:transcriptional regulator with XRE-family HTH domain
MKNAPAVAVSAAETKAVSKLVPRRAPGTQGRRAPNYPDLNFRRIAEAIGVSSTFLGRVMNGRARASIATAQKLAAYLDWPLDRVAGLYGSKELSRKFPYRKQESSRQENQHGKSIERPAGRGAKRTGAVKSGSVSGGKRTDASPVRNIAHKGKHKRKAGAASAGRTKSH